MKKFKVSILTLLTIAITSVAFYSCSDEDNESITESVTIEINEIGKWHNIAVELYKEKVPSSKKKIGLNKMRPLMQSLLQEEYPEKFNDIKELDLKQFSNASYRTSKNGDFGLNQYLLDTFNFLEDQGEISETTAAFFITSINNELDTNDFATAATNYLNTNNLTNDEMQYVNVFVDVMNNSTELWGNGGAQSKLNCNSQIAIADAAGAATGLFGGPLWSIIQGAIVSVAVSEDCED